MAIMGKRALTDHKDVDLKVNEYFELRKSADLPPFITGLALHLGISRIALFEYRRYKTQVLNNKHLPLDHEEMILISDIVEKASQRCEAWIEENMLMNKVNPVASIFNLKNNYKWNEENVLMLKGDQDNPLVFQNNTETALLALSILEDNEYISTELPQIDEESEVSEGREDFTIG